MHLPISFRVSLAQRQSCDYPKKDVTPHETELTQRAHTCTENVPKTRFQDVHNVNAEKSIRPKIRRLGDSSLRRPQDNIFKTSKC